MNADKKPEITKFNLLEGFFWNLEISTKRHTWAVKSKINRNTTKAFGTVNVCS